MKLTRLVEDKIKFADGKGSPLSPLQQVCLAMTYFASDTPQRSAGYIAGVKSTCANQTVKRVVYSICELAPRFIKMPTLEQMQETADYFEDKYKNYSIHFANFFKLFSILNVAIYYSSIALIHLIVSWPNKPLASMLVLKKIAMKDFIRKFKSTLS